MQGSYYTIVFVQSEEQKGWALFYIVLGQLLFLGVIYLKVFG